MQADMKTYNRLAGILFFLAYFLMLGQFFLSRGNKKVLKSHKMGKVVKLHKVIGYIFVSILLVHPFLIVVPRFFEAGIAPGEAFGTMLTTWDSQGIILGMIAWVLMLILATWHAMDLGRHTDLPMSLYMGAIAGIGVLLLLRTYLFNPAKTEI